VIKIVRIGATIIDMFLEADDTLFRRILSKNTHVLQKYLPDKTEIVYFLCIITHNKSLISKTSDLNERNFLVTTVIDCY